MKIRISSILLALACSVLLSSVRAQSDIPLTGYTRTFDEEFNTLSVTASSPKGTSTWFDWPPYGSSGAYSNSIWDINAFSVNSNVLSDKAWIVTGQDTAGAYSGGPVSMKDGSGTAVVTAVTPGTGVNSHSNFQWDGYVGMKFTTSASGLVVSQLGRYVYSGNTQTHDLKLIDAATGNDVPNSVVTVATSGATAGTFVYGNLPNGNITLSASHAYYLLSHESNGGGDYWYSGTNTTVTTTSAITVNGSEWGEWHSGNLSSMDTTAVGWGQQYGYFETYCQMPSSGTGAWTSFWLSSQNGILNNNNHTSLPDEEIDIFEWYGSSYTNNTSVVEEHNHNWVPTGGPTGLAASPQIPGAALPWLGYHVYGCQVDPEYITWYIDGVQVSQIATPPGYITSENYMMFDYALGGASTGMVNPSTFSAKWIRVYSLPTWPIIYNTMAEGTLNTAFSYQVVAENSPTSYGATGLPAGLSINTSSGLISGTPIGSGTYPVTVSATNANGTGTATLTLAVSSGAGIGIQFKGNGTALPSTSSAGVPATTQVHWNVESGSSFSGAALVDSTGTTTTATLSGTSVGIYWGGGSTAPPAGNADLASGELYNGSTAGTHALTVSGIPYASYDVYVYASIDTGGKNETVSLTPSGGAAQYYSFTTEAGAPTWSGAPMWTAATSTWNGTGTVPLLPAANCVHYTGLTASSFSMTFFAPTNGSINAIQIAPNSSLPGPVGYWQFSEGTGTTTADASGNGINGTLTNSPSWITGGKFADALSFNGTTNYVNMGNTSTTGPLKPALPVTISAWVKLTNTSGVQRIFSSDNSDNSSIIAGYDLSLASGVLACDYGDGGGSGPSHRRSKIGTTTLATGTWYHVAATIQSATSMSLYVNGADDGGTYSGTGGTMAYTTTSSKVATGSTTQFFAGTVDDVRVYNRVLDSTEVGLLANPPVGNWRFDEATGTTANDSGTAGITGTLTNSPTWVSGWFSDALNFNGTNSYVNLNNASTTGPLKPALPVTVSAWVKLTSTSGTQMIFASDTWGSTYAGYSLQVGGGVLACSYGSATGGNGPAYRRTKGGTTVMAAGTWYHVTAVIQGATNMQLYVNGVDDGGTYSGTGGTMAYTSAASTIGEGGGSEFVNGVIDDVRVYNYALSATQVDTLAAPDPGVIPPE